MQKKIISFLIVGCVVLGLCACSNNSTDEVEEYSTETTIITTELQTTEVQISELETIVTTLPETTEPKRLSADCDKVLASGYDAENNYFELVGNETENYDGTKIEIGIIKNNEWAIPLTLNSPFVSENGLLIGAEGSFNGSIFNKFAEFNYIGAGCFSYRNKYIWNGNTGVAHVTDGTIVIGYNTHNLSTVVNNEGLFLVDIFYGKNYQLLDVNTMTTTEIPFVDNGDCCFPYSEGLFAYIDRLYDEDFNGFYDIYGNKVIDLSNYNLVESTYTISGSGGYTGPLQYLVFKNGECTFTIKNDQGTEFIITIDKAGNVINSVQK